MSDGVPLWIVENSKETSETFGMPFHEALELELSMAIYFFGYPLPERDPVKEDKRKKAVANQRVLNPERLYD